MRQSLRLSFVTAGSCPTTPARRAVAFTLGGAAVPSRWRGARPSATTPRPSAAAPCTPAAVRALPYWILPPWSSPAVEAKSPGLRWFSAASSSIARARSCCAPRAKRSWTGPWRWYSRSQIGALTASWCALTRHAWDRRPEVGLHPKRRLKYLTPTEPATLWRMARRCRRSRAQESLLRLRCLPPRAPSCARRARHGCTPWTAGGGSATVAAVARP